MYNHDKKGTLPGVSCTAANCIYHCQGNECKAPSILVGTDSADSKKATMCSTFECSSNCK